VTSKHVGRRPSSAYQAALRRLARRDHSEQELRRVLQRRGYATSAVEGAIERLRSASYIDDAGFARRFALSRLAYRGLGRNRIRAALRQRGVPRSVAEEGLASALREVTESELLDELANKYWTRHERDEPRKRVLKLRAFLLRRGFAADLVANRLRSLWPDWSAELSDWESSAEEFQA
jgi:regulatory protein